MAKLTVDEFRDILSREICDKETSLDPDGWTPENPFWGHCAVVSVLAKLNLGGELLRASLEGTDFEDMRSHYWNRLPDGTEVDFTAPQFGDNYPQGLQPETRTVEYVLSNEETMKRFSLLLIRFMLVNKKPR